MKQYYTQENIGSCKYMVSFHDGISTHKDGSRLFDVRIFRTKKKMFAFIKQLENEGYKEL